MKEKKVFVIYGRNLHARNQLYRFLKDIGLDPLEWNDAVSLTHKTSPFIEEIIEAVFSEVQALIVLLTGDEIIKLLDVYTKNNEENSVELQCRPNVLFEAGYAFGKNPNHTIVVQLGKHRKVSDLEGRYFIHLDNSLEKKMDLIGRLKTAGCDINENCYSYLLKNNDVTFDISSDLQFEHIKKQGKFLNFYPTREYGLDFASMLNFAKHDILIVGVKFGNIIQQTDLLYEKILTNKNFTATLLFLSPIYKNGNDILWLDEVEKFNGFSQLKEGLILTIKNLKRLKMKLKDYGKSYSNRLTIKGYCTLPTASFVFYDRRDSFAIMKMEPFNYQVVKVNRLSFDIKKSEEPEVFDTYLKSVNQLVKISIDINDSAYDCYKIK